MKKVSENVFFVLSLFFTGLYFTLYSTNQDGTVTPKFQTVNNVFYDSEFARGFVRLANGFTVEKKASGVGSTHGSCVFMDTCVSVSGAIDLRETNTIFLQSDLILDHGVTFSSGGNIYGYDRALILNGDLTIPDGKIIHTGGRVVIDGNGHKLLLGNSAQLFVDTDATLTLRNLVLQNTRNQPGHPAVQCASSGSKLCLDDVELALADDFYFNRGQMFIHNDVAVTGTSAFVYRSCQPSLITSDSKLYFDLYTTFSVAPATFTDCPYTVNSTYTTNNFILMADQTSQLYLNGCSFFATLTGERFFKGTVCFENKVAIRSNASSKINATTPVTLIATATTEHYPQSVSWSPDGRFLAVINGFTSNYLQIFRFNGSGIPTQVGIVATGSGPYSVTWSPDGRFLAVANSNSDTLQIFRFDGSGDPTQVGSNVTTGNYPASVSWSPDGRFLAVVNISATTLQIFKFDGSGTPTQVGGNATTRLGPRLASWSPDGRFLAIVTGTAPNSVLQIFRFNGSSTPTQVGSYVTIGAAGASVSWSPDGRFVATVDSGSLRVFKFNGLDTPIQIGGNASTGSSSESSSVSWSPDGRLLVVVNYWTSTLQMFSFNGSETPIQVGGNVTTGSNPYSESWSSDGRFIAVVNSIDDNLQIFRVNYVVDRTTQALSNSIVLGNSALGSSYDLNVRVLSCAQVAVDGLLNCDNVN